MEAVCSDTDLDSEQDIEEIDLTCKEKLELDEFISDDDDQVLHACTINIKPKKSSSKSKTLVPVVASSRNRVLKRGNAFTSPPKPKRHVQAIPQKKFQIRSMVNLFTINKCELTSSQDVLDVFLQVWDNTRYPVKLVISQEKHADGDLHYHMCCYYASTPSIYITPSVLALQFHAANFDISSSRYRAWKNALKYTVKGNGDIVCWPDNYSYGEDLEVELKVSEKVYHELKNGTSLEKLLELYTPYMMANYNKVKQIRDLMKNAAKQIVPKGINDLWEHLCDPGLLNSHSSRVIQWMRTNICVPERPFRTKNLWIEGAPGIGKSYTMHMLAQYVRVYYLSDLENWYRFDEDDYDVIVLDEWKGGPTNSKGEKNVQLFNHLLDGSRITLNIKFGNTIKTKNLPFIVLSNFRIAEVYRDNQNSVEVRALQDRFEEVWFRCENMHIFKLPQYLADEQEALDIAEEEAIRDQLKSKRRRKRKNTGLRELNKLVS